MALTPENARIADEAIEKVRAAIASARAVLDSESSFLTFITGSESAHAARVSSLIASERILDQLVGKRPGLADSTLPGFLALASEAADMTSLIQESKRMTASGFNREVISPTLDDLNPLNPFGALGKTVLVAALLALIIFAGSRR